MVTFNLSSVDYYDENALFNVLDGAVNNGWLGIYRVSPNGFSIRKIDSGQLFYSENFRGTVLVAVNESFRYTGKC